MLDRFWRRPCNPPPLRTPQFDALGAARGNASGGDESASIINELLVQVGGRLHAV